MTRRRLGSTRVCPTPGCGHLAPAGELCDRCRHVARRREDRRRPSAGQRGYGTRWQHTRARFLREHPYCEWPEACGHEAVDVHHLDGLGPGGPRGHDPANLRALCHRHHSILTAREGGSFGR